jgi:hypothetical protein
MAAPRIVAFTIIEPIHRISRPKPPISCAVLLFCQCCWTLQSERKAQEGRDLRNEGRVEDGKAPKTTKPGTGHPEKKFPNPPGETGRIFSRRFTLARASAALSRFFSPRHAASSDVSFFSIASISARNASAARAPAAPSSGGSTGQSRAGSLHDFFGSLRRRAPGRRLQDLYRMTANGQTPSRASLPIGDVDEIGGRPLQCLGDPYRQPHACGELSSAQAGKLVGRATQMIGRLPPSRVTRRSCGIQSPWSLGKLQRNLCASSASGSWTPAVPD